MKKGLVLEGGGLRGIFTAGILDVLMEEGIEFDGAVGVSAGAAFGCNYKSKQPRRAVRYNLKFAKDHRYASMRSLLSTGDLFGAQFCYHDIPEKLFPFDWETFRENPMEFYAVCTDVETGKPVYHLCGDEPDYEMLEWFRASGSMPLVSRVVEVGGYKLLDGGIADSIPLRFMEEQGYERNLVILTRPAGYVKKINPMMPVISRALRQYPEAVRAMERRHLVYNETLAYVRQREAGKYAFVIRPETDLDIGRIEHDRIKIRAVYKEGRRMARRLLPAIRRFLSSAETAKTAKTAMKETSVAKPALEAPVSELPTPGIAAPEKEAPTAKQPVPEKARTKAATILKEAPAAVKETFAQVRKRVPLPPKTSEQEPVSGQKPFPDKTAVETDSAALTAQPASSQAQPVSSRKLPASSAEQAQRLPLPSIPQIKRRRRAWRPGEMTALKQRIGWEREDR